MNIEEKFKKAATIANDFLKKLPSEEQKAILRASGAISASAIYAVLLDQRAEAKFSDVTGEEALQLMADTLLQANQSFEGEDEAAPNSLEN